MTESSNGYAIATTLCAGRASAEFGVGPMDAWLAGLRDFGLRRAVPQLVLKLDRMSRVALPAAGRLAVLRKVKRPLLKVAAGLPKHVGTERRQNTDDAQALLLEQRLYCLMARNLKQVLQDLDRSMDSRSAQVDKSRRWALRNLFRFLGRQIEFGLYWEHPLPPQTWQELHDLYSYVSYRGIARARGKGRRARSGRDLDPDGEYKRLLLLGLEGRLVQKRPRSSVFLDELDSWAEDTTLESPCSFIGACGLYVAETLSDTPPRLMAGALTESFCGWVLKPAKGFLGYTVAAARDDLASAPRVGMRSVSGMN